MFDPTIFDNIKIVIEGELYERDLSEEIIITKRQDIVDLADMSRKFIIQFKSRDYEMENYAELFLSATTEDLAKEILELNTTPKPGAELSVKYYIPMINEKHCEEFNTAIKDIWDNRPRVIQKISYIYRSDNQLSKQVDAEILLKFDRKIDEENIKDLNSLVKHTLKTLETLNKIQLHHTI